MKLIEAFHILSQAPATSTTPLQVFLACGFSPLHLETFLAAELQVRFPDRTIRMSTGLFGDLLGSLQRMLTSGCDSGVVALEWPDFDARLGLRQSGGWRRTDLADIGGSVRQSATRIGELLLAAHIPVAVSLPGLPLPPLNINPSWQAGALDLEILACIASMAARLGQRANLRILHPQALDRQVSPAERHDFKSEVLSGFPYAMPYASAVARTARQSLYGSEPKKGLITDLDDTLWSGILGEVGVSGISWDLDHHSQQHAVYQRLLASLADAGRLLAVASKNDPAVVEEALRRRDLLVAADQFFPVEAQWGPKSEAASRILNAWNVAADSVVFVDDSPLECAEVQAAHPGMECIPFPRNDYRELMRFYRRLRDLLGVSFVREEDVLRRESLRQTAARATVDPTDTDAFLAQTEAEVCLSFAKQGPGGRAFELVNKTNQFNLNGRRYTESEWAAALAAPEALLATVAYQDKYGPLGVVAVLLGRRESQALYIDQWVMSCRAFARRIEHRSLAELFRRFGADELVFDFSPTPRNGPMQDFLMSTLGERPMPGCRLGKVEFFEKCPQLHHRVAEHDDGVCPTSFTGASNGQLGSAA
jgi:FkbH-like protein